MPHLQIQYSENLAQRFDIGALCGILAQEIAAIGLYPLGGIRVRACRADHAAIADLHPDNAFLDAVFRIGEGRSQADKQQSGARLMDKIEQFFASEIDQGHLMLSLEIVEIDAAHSWKTNSIHKRLKKEKNNVA